MRRICAVALAALVAAFSSASAAFAQTAEPQTSELQRFAEDPNFWSVTLSPSGRYVAGIRQDEDAQRILIIDWRAGQAYALQTAGAESGISFNGVAWKSDDRLIFSANFSLTILVGEGPRARERGGIQTALERIFAIDRDGANMVQMLEDQRTSRLASMRMIDRLASDPDHILFASSGRGGPVLWRADINTGRGERVEQGGWDTRTWYTDGVGAGVLRLDELPRNSGFRVRRRSEGEWQVVVEVRRSNVEGTPDFQYVAPGPGPGQVYAIARPDHRNLAALYLYDVNTGSFGEPLFADDEADVSTAWIDPRTHALVAACVHRQRYQCRASDANVSRHLSAINSFFEGRAAVSLTAMSDDAMTWLAFVQGATIPPAYFIYDRTQASIQPIAPLYSAVAEADLSPTEVVNYAARDGQPLWGYLTRRGGAARPQPLIVMPHGGPEARDYYGYDWLVQFLASRGYAVFQPQFRGSEGMGRSFAEAGYRQWGLRMQDDISDGVRHLIDSGEAAAERICIVGISYGGYAALAGASLTPDLYECAVSIAGVGDLGEFLRWSRAEEGRGSQAYAYWVRAIGHPDDDRDALSASSPAQQAVHVRAPVLIIHGMADSIVPVAQAELTHEALQAAGKDVTYWVVEGEGHSPNYWSVENRVAFLEALDSFLGEHNPAN